MYCVPSVTLGQAPDRDYSKSSTQQVTSQENQWLSKSDFIAEETISHLSDFVLEKNEDVRRLNGRYVFFH